MNLLQATLLGVVQGLTEFLPVSSSGHLALLENFWRIPLAPQQLQTFDVILHAGTLLALLFIYARTWWKLLQSFFKPTHEYRPLLLALIVATIPAVVAGLLVEDLIADIFRTASFIGVAFIVTGIVLILGEHFPVKQHAMQLPQRRALIVGCAQVLALIPGVSRSGMTISAGRSVGLSRKEALDFSFMMSVPIIGGATVLALRDVSQGSMATTGFSLFVAGFFTSFFVSLFAIIFLRRWVVSHSLVWFAFYLIPLGIVLALFV